MNYIEDSNFLIPLEDGVIYETIEDDIILNIACYNYTTFIPPYFPNHKNA